MFRLGDHGPLVKDGARAFFFLQVSGRSLSTVDVSHCFSLLKPFLHFLQTHQLDHSAHYVRLKFLIENQIQFYVPKPEEDIYELVMLPTEQN